MILIHNLYFDLYRKIKRGVKSEAGFILQTSV
jgi:hypothetical protein